MPRHDLVRRLLLIELVLGGFVSALASGRFSVRLIVDGAISCAFLPAVEVAAFAVVLAMRVGRPLPFSRALGLYLAGNTPWLLWLSGVAVVAAVVPPRQIGFMFWPVVVAAVAPAVWSARLDVRFFESAMGRPPRAALGDVLLSRAVGWSLATTYFLGIAIWTELPAFFRSLGW